MLGNRSRRAPDDGRRSAKGERTVDNEESYQILSSAEGKRMEAIKILESFAVAT